MAKTASPNTSSTNSWTPTHDEIAAQAYQIYLREGCVEGRDMDHWLRAESELRERATSNGNGNGHSNGAVSQPRSQREQQEQQQQTAEPVNRGGAKQDQGSVLPNSVVPPTAPIAQVNRGTTPKRNPNKREAAAVK